MKFIKTTFKILVITTLAFALGLMAVRAQDEGENDYARIEKMQDKNMDYIRQLSKITDQYPFFTYHYNMEDGKVKSVKVTGVDNTIDTKKIEVILLNLQSNKNELDGKPNRIGVFYSVDESPRYKEGKAELERKLQNYLKYPEGAKNWGVEGTVYVKFVVDANGNIPYASATNDIKTNNEFYVDDLEKQAVSAIKKTSGEWIPGKIKGVNVSSFFVIPVRFDIKRNPGIPVMIH